ncbi:PAS domain S-box-containing protein [Methylobacterium sp. PvP062]|uniref:histidine kinase n=1 Tax=Methylobacterium radiotolerans TaxID=31998 RepID=A0ABV2NKW5_9HYPH|nr:MULTISPECIES: response regulator [unclassified Methylobacterium]MBP2496192.1 PAS domain S-box-containing protein [Methylobacterium sp. PvP105]MBP2503936.1 PAS domain S-box-containing protein [Methylobacterium sp. PvP109]MCX7336028.1 response regulator [Hyphomicrobiales bacterium]
MTDRLEFRPTGAAAAAEQLAGLATPDAVRAKILIVDDDQRNLLAASEILADPAIDMVLANSPEEALRRALREDFAVILLDVQMPRMDGYEVAALIRSRSRTSRVPILFLTAHNKDDMHIFRGYSAGAVDYVFKPIQPLVLKSKVDVFVDLYRKTEEIKRKAAAEKQLLLENLRVRGEKLEAEQALRRQAEHQAAVLRGLPIALYTSPLGVEDRRLHFTNDSIERITGFSREAFAGSSLWESRLEAEDRNRVLADLRTVSEVGAVALEYRWRNADGTERHILDQIAVNRDESGTGVELFGMWFDVTERKELELSLQHASKLEAVGRLTGGIAHDFNNMLSIVIGNLDLMKGSLQGNEKALRRVESAIEGAHRCAELTSRLLAFSRRSPLQPRALDFTSFIPGLVKLLERTLGEQITISAKLEENLPEVCVDHAQFEAALINLAVNARDAMPNGGTLSISIRRGEPGVQDGIEPVRCVEITVTDMGTGMSPGVLARVFEPFFTTKETGKGTGLGLSMVYGFVQQSGGTITVNSNPDQGTRFVITLPEIVKGNFTPEHAHPHATRGVPDPLDGAGRAVLVVEDDADVRSTVVSTLEALAFKVLSATDGAEAVDMLQNVPDIALVFSDVNMPGAMTGIDLGHLVRQRWPKIQILLSSGYLKENQDTNGFALLQKPYRAADLIEILRGLIGETDEVVSSDR